VDETASHCDRLVLNDTGHTGGSRDNFPADIDCMRWGVTGVDREGPVLDTAALYDRRIVILEAKLLSTGCRIKMANQGTLR
jgi:hypothetical protein